MSRKKGEARMSPHYLNYHKTYGTSHPHLLIRNQLFSCTWVHCHHMYPTFSLHSIILLHDRIFSHYHGNIHELTLAEPEFSGGKEYKQFFIFFFYFLISIFKNGFYIKNIGELKVCLSNFLFKVFLI